MRIYSGGISLSNKRSRRYKKKGEIRADSLDLAVEKLSSNGQMIIGLKRQMKPLIS